jgi:hypothetical protein
MDGGMPCREVRLEIGMQECEPSFPLLQLNHCSGSGQKSDQVHQSFRHIPRAEV